MIDDPLRTGPLVRAIEEAVRKGDVVIDIGTGLGLLAIAAVKAGAGKVHAVEIDEEALKIAKKRAADEGLAERIEFTCCLSFDLEIPQKADLIICETVGSYAFDENILATLKDTKERLLKDDGRIIPQNLEMWGAPLRRVPKLEGPAEIALVGKDDLAGAPMSVQSVDFSADIPESIHQTVEFTCDVPTTIEAIAVWPRATWWNKNVTDASPLEPPTHWKQGILPIESRKVQRGEVVKVEIIIEPHPDDPLTMTERLWKWAE